MTEQRKAAGPGDTNSVTHELKADEGKPEASAAAKHTSKGARVQLRVNYPHVRFDLSAHDLPPVTNEGTYYTSAQADEVLMLAMKHGVPVYRVKDEEN